MTPCLTLPLSQVAGAVLNPDPLFVDTDVTFRRSLSLRFVVRRVLDFRNFDFDFLNVVSVSCHLLSGLFW